MCFGSFIQDESNVLAIDSKNTVEAVQFMADLYARGEPSDVFDWSPVSNSQLVLAGKRSLIQNAVSVIYRADDLGMPFAKDLWIWPVPHGPGGRLALGQYTSVYSIWKFAQNRDAAEKFIADFCIACGPGILASRMFDFPSFPGSIPLKEIYRTAAADTHRPRGKYSILTTIAASYTRNLGYPGYANGAVAETFDRYLIPRMFAQVSQGKTSAADSVRSTAKEMKRIWAKWRAAGKI